MFDSFAVVKIIEFQNESDRARWKKDEDAFYRELGGDPFERASMIWRYLRWMFSIGPGNKKDRRNVRRSVVNACGNVSDQAAR